MGGNSEFLVFGETFNFEKQFSRQVIFNDKWFNFITNLARNTVTFTSYFIDILDQPIGKHCKFSLLNRNDEEGCSERFSYPQEVSARDRKNQWF